MTPALAGALALGLPLLIADAIVARMTGIRQIFWFGLALLVVALGYLASTGALDDIGNAVLNFFSAAASEKSPEPVPAK